MATDSGMIASKFTLAPLLLALTACSPACNTPEAIPPAEADSGRSPDRPIKAVPTPQASSDEQVNEAKGVDLTKLTEPQRTNFFQILNTEPSACDKPHSLAVSLRDDATCRDSLPVSQFIADALASGASPSDVKMALEEVVDSLRVRDINIDGRPVYGNERAPVTVVVFADFECPHCRAEAPVLKRTVDEYRGRAKLVFKHFPISGHIRAKPAAIATMAAHKQGKFWEMAEIVFENQTALEDADIRAYAKRIGLDMAKFDADVKAGYGRDLVEADRVEGDKLEITGTPAVFINGRYYNPLLFGGTVTGWIDDALRR
ncbi:MAG: thioredoxin domain-containing protein [Nannocystaceae bacterium]